MELPALFVGTRGRTSSSCTCSQYMIGLRLSYRKEEDCGLEDINQEAEVDKKIYLAFHILRLNYLFTYLLMTF